MLQACRTSITSHLRMIILLLPEWGGNPGAGGRLGGRRCHTPRAVIRVLHTAGHVDMHNQPGDMQNCDTVLVVQYVWRLYCQSIPLSKVSHIRTYFSLLNIFLTSRNTYANITKLVFFRWDAAIFLLFVCLFSLTSCSLIGETVAWHCPLVG